MFRLQQIIPALICIFITTNLVSAAQVCTTTVLVNKDLNGISGSSDANVIAVGKDGNIARWNGASWAVMTSPTTEDLFDVEVVDANTAFAVGKDGVILHWDGSIWIEQPTPIDKDLEGVWAASANEAWAVGDKGIILYWDGVSWTDVSVAAQSEEKDMTDAWGDNQSFYSLDKDGRLFHFNRITDSWDVPDILCDFGGGDYEDLWGDGAGNIYLVKKKEVYLNDGVSCSLVAAASKDLLGIYGVSTTEQVVAVGKDGRVLEYDGTTWTETDEGIDDFRDVWVSRNGNAYYAGKKGELTACQCTDCHITGFKLAHDNFAIHCADETMRVDVIDTLTGDPYAGYGGELILDTGNSNGSWSKLSGSGVFNDPSPDGRASYFWPVGESSAEFALSYRTGPPVINIDVYDSVDTDTRDDDSEGDLVFSASGFSVTAAPLSNPPPPLVMPFSGPVTAGNNFDLHIAAFGQTPGDPECGVIESYDGLQNLRFWSDYVDPLTGTIAVSIDGVGIAGSQGAAANQSVLFTAGQASVIAKYKDAGRLQIFLQDISNAHPDLPGGILGATAPFVSRPDHFVLSNIINAAAMPNPGAVDASGPVFTAAGDPFSVTVSAVDSEGDVTPNFGNEAMPESVLLTPVLRSPVAGNNPPIDFATGFTAFVSGQATGDDFSWPEVGVIQLRPSIADMDYLGTGDVTGDNSNDVGRFIPHHFATAVNSPVLDTYCDSGAFTYIGQPFNYLMVPVVAVTAQAANNADTLNYTASYWKLTNASLANRIYSAGTATLDTSGLPATTVDPVIADLGGGAGTLTFSSGSGLLFQRLAPVAIFDAAIQLNIDVIDLDSVAATSNPVNFGNPGGIAFDSGRSMRYGRIRIESALGSELIDLAVPMQAEYYVDDNTAFVTHLSDNCSDAVTISFSSFAGNLNAAETCVMDNGTPGNSAAGCVAPAPATKQYQEPPPAGDFNLFLLAPGAGNDGSVSVDATVPAWLQFDWSAATPGNENPSGQVTFGIYRGDDQTIYQREVY